MGRDVCHILSLVVLNLDFFGRVFKKDIESMSPYITHFTEIRVQVWHQFADCGTAVAALFGRLSPLLTEVFRIVLSLSLEMKRFFQFFASSQTYVGHEIVSFGQTLTSDRVVGRVECQPVRARAVHRLTYGQLRDQSVIDQVIQLVYREQVEVFGTEFAGVCERVQ